MHQHTVFRSRKKAGQALDGPVVTLGNFDGMHLGHQAIFGRVRELAARRDTRTAALTFEPHPVRFFKPDAPPFRLTPERQKLALFAEYGLDAALVLEFNHELAQLSPEAFVEEVLHRDVGARMVVVGEDFRFGKGRSGTAEDLKDLCAARGIEAEIASPVLLDEAPISSTRVRQALQASHMEEITRLMGRPFRLTGEVVHGDKRGRKLGYPTANIETVHRLLPPNGIYATTLHAPNLPALHSVTSVGTRPTFGGEDITVECFVLDQDEPDSLDLYGADVSLDLWKFMRPEVAFDGPEELVTQIRDDVADVREFFML